MKLSKSIYELIIATIDYLATIIKTYILVQIDKITVKIKAYIHSKRDTTA